MRPPSETVAVAEITDIRAIHGWISAFLSERPLSDMRKIAQWQAWAALKLAGGWTAHAVKQRIVDAWAEHAGLMGISAETLAPDSPLAKALFEGFDETRHRASPAQLAVLYRALALEHPDHATWLARYAAIFADMGAEWRELRPYLIAGW